MAKAKWTTHKHLSGASAKLANSGRIGRKNAPTLTDGRTDVKRTRKSELFTCSPGTVGGSKARLNAFDSVRPDRTGAEVTKTTDTEVTEKTV